MSKRKSKSYKGENKMDASKQEPEVQAQEVQEDASWPYQFTEAEVEGWKQQYGADNVNLISLVHEGTETEDIYVMRGLFRDEFLKLQTSDFRNEEDLEEQFVLRSVLWPHISAMTLRDADAATPNRLFERLVQISNVDAQRELDVVELTEDNLPESIEKSDYQGWKGRMKGGKMFMVEFEGQPFIYKGLRRNEYEKFRDAQRDEGKNQHDSENQVCSLSVLYPLPKDFEPEGDKYLYGTISSLAVMIMRVSGFGSASTVTKL